MLEMRSHSDPEDGRVDISFHENKMATVRFSLHGQIGRRHYPLLANPSTMTIEIGRSNKNHF
jgi:hypothetical protein